MARCASASLAFATLPILASAFVQRALPTGAAASPIARSPRAVSPRSVVAEANTAVVAGGGPAGLATALILAQRGFDVTVLEKRAEPNPYEPQRAYLYLVDGRGQRFTDAAGLTEELASPATSVSSLNYTVTRCLPDGQREEAVPPILDLSSTFPRPFL